MSSRWRSPGVSIITGYGLERRMSEHLAERVAAVGEPRFTSSEA
jgi:hypothetical protein